MIDLQATLHILRAFACWDRTILGFWCICRWHRTSAWLRVVSLCDLLYWRMRPWWHSHLLRSYRMRMLKVLRALMGRHLLWRHLLLGHLLLGHVLLRHLLWRHAVLVVHSLRRCSLWTGLGMTVLLVLSGALLCHGRVNIGVIH